MKIAIWSCSKRTKQYDQPAWSKIKKYNPDFCIDLGDSWYFPQSEKSYKKKNRQKTLHKMESAIKLQREHADYSLLADKTFSIFDDHCFASNNSGAWLPEWVKSAAKAFKMVAFKSIPNAVTERKGLYYSYVQEGVKFIFLDVRTFRQKYGHIWLFGRGFLKKKRANLLGLKQWMWLENELKTSEQRIVICSGSTINGKDGWSSYKNDKKMLTDMIKHSSKNFLLLTGDIHKNKKTYHDDMGCHEITTSGVGRDNLNNFAMLHIVKDSSHVLFYGKHLAGERVVIDF